MRKIFCIALLFVFSGCARIVPPEPQTLLSFFTQPYCCSFVDETGRELQCSFRGTGQFEMQYMQRDFPINAAVNGGEISLRYDSLEAVFPLEILPEDNSIRQLIRILSDIQAAASAELVTEEEFYVLMQENGVRLCFDRHTLLPREIRTAGKQYTIHSFIQEKGAE